MGQLQCGASMFGMYIGVKEVFRVEKAVPRMILPKRV